MEAPRKHGAFDMRWTCAQKRPLPRHTQRTRLRLVPREAAATESAEQREISGTRRIVAAIAAHVASNRT